jgi:hypothetical protein
MFGLLLRVLFILGVRMRKFIRCSFLRHEIGPRRVNLSNLIWWCYAHVFALHTLALQVCGVLRRQWGVLGVVDGVVWVVGRIVLEVDMLRLHHEGRVWDGVRREEVLVVPRFVHGLHIHNAVRHGIWSLAMVL